MTEKHLSSQFDAELNRVSARVMELGGLVEAQLRTAVQALTSFSTEAVLDFMIFDRDNPGSIYRCLRATRENAHAVRGTLTSEMWETTNGTWLKMRDFSPAKR